MVTHSRSHDSNQQHRAAKKIAPRVNSQKYQPVCSGLEISHRGRSPDFVHRGAALPSFPVATQAVPVHSDCIVPDSHRILYSPPRGGTSAIQFYIFSDIADYSISRRIVNEKSAAAWIEAAKIRPVRRPIRRADRAVGEPHWFYFFCVARHQPMPQR